VFKYLNSTLGVYEEACRNVRISAECLVSIESYSSMKRIFGIRQIRAWFGEFSASEAMALWRYRSFIIIIIIIIIIIEWSVE